MDCEERFPATLLNALRPRMCSASRFCVRKTVPAEAQVAKFLIEAAWIEARRAGVRLDIIDVHERAIRYYTRLGYYLVADSFFVHPLWQTPSHVMVFPAHEARATPIRHVFQGMSDGLLLDDLRPHVALVGEA